MLLQHGAGLVADDEKPDLLQFVPIRHDAMLDLLLKCHRTRLALIPVANVLVLLVYTSYDTR